MNDKRQWISLTDLKAGLGQRSDSAADPGSASTAGSLPPSDTGSAPTPRPGSVYSTELGRLCPACGHPQTQCQCRAQAQAATVSGGPPRIRRETKGRKGKGVTVIAGLPLTGEALEHLARALRQHCGVGGTTRPGCIELQGDQQDKARAYLEREGLLKAPKAKR